MHYILDDLDANNPYDFDCNSVDLLQFFNMFNSHVEDNMQVSLKRSDTKKELFVLNEKGLLFFLLSTISPDSWHPYFEHTLYSVDFALKRPIMIFSKRNLQAHVVEISLEKI